MNEFIITSDKIEMEVVSHGTIYTNNNGQSIEFLKYMPGKSVHDGIGIVFLFPESVDGKPRVEGGDVGFKELRHGNMFHTYEFRVFNITGDKTTSIEGQQCANFAGGSMYISFTAFAGPHKEKGIHYTIWQWQR